MVKKLIFCTLTISFNHKPSAMKHLKLLMGAAAFSFILMTGCKKDIAPQTAPDPVQIQDKLSNNPSAPSALKVKLKSLRSTLPAGSEKRLQKTAGFLTKQNPEYGALLRRIFKMDPAECDANTPLNQWLDQQLADWDDEVFYLASVSGMLIFPTYDALLFENSSANQHFGVKGEYTQRVTKTFKDLKRFWNIESGGMVLAAMHGSMLRDREKLIRIDMILYGDDQPTAEFWADLILLLLREVPQYRNGDHPIFTFNAYAQDSFEFPPYGIIPKKIVMGDGIMEAYTAIGYNDVAPQAILAHEFGHQVQYQLNLFEGEGPEATRRTELMADAFSAYYLSHARGASMQWKRVKQFLQVFFNIGDCAFDSFDHHGTPKQRMAAAEWAYHLADNAQKQGHILTAQAFSTLFDAQLPLLVAY